MLKPKNAHDISKHGLEFEDNLILLGGSPLPWIYEGIENYPEGTRYIRTNGENYRKGALDSNPATKDFVLIGSNNIDVSMYYSKIEVDALLEDIRMVAAGHIADIVRFPVYITNASSLKYGWTYNSSNDAFYKRVPTAYYVNENTTAKQAIVEVNGSGFLTSIMLPQLANNNGSDRQVTLDITIDGNTTTETFIYSNINGTKYRLFLGTLTAAKKNHLEDVHQALTKYDDKFADSVISTRRPVQFAETGKADHHINNPNEYLANIQLPRMSFKTNMKIEYTVNQLNMYSSDAYKNRAMALFMLGDF